MSRLIARPSSSIVNLGAGLAPIALLGLLAACAGGASQPAPANPGYGGADSGQAAAAEPASPQGYGGGAPSPAPDRMSADAPSARGGMDMESGAYEPAPSPREQPRDRPGLGTVFGETRVSAVRSSPFVRATAQPYAAVVLHYNDAEGVQAHAQYRGQDWLSPYYAYTPGRGISVALVDERGNILQGGATADRNFIIGQEGQRYEIVVHNQTGGRFEVLGSVDGLDVIDGLPAHFEKRGYVLEPHGTLRIEGWRRSEREVAAFRFGRVSDSYAAQTTGDRNVGVIGFAFFAERGSAWTTDELERRDTANPFPAQSGYAQPPRN